MSDTFEDRITTTMCVCGSRRWMIWIGFNESGSLASHSLDMVCCDCKFKANIPVALIEDGPIT